MPAKKSASPVSNGQITFDLTIPLKQITAEYAKILGKIVATSEIKGFRKGKAPVAMVEQSMDKSKIYTQILDALIPEAYYKAVQEQSIAPIIDPSIAPKQFEEGKDWVFTVTTAVKPSVELGDYAKYVSKALKEFEKNKKPEKVEKGHEGHDHEGEAKLTIIFDTLLKEAKVEVAPILVEQEAKSQLSRLIKQLSELKLTIADFAKSQKKTEKEITEEYEKTALTNLKLELILDKIVELENPAVSEEEIAKLNAPKGQEAYAKYVLQKQKIVDNLKKL